MSKDIKAYAEAQTLLARLTSTRAGYLDNINQVGLLQVTATRAGNLDGLPRGVFDKTQWCTPQSIIASLAFTNAGGDKSFPSVVFPAGFLPAGVVVQEIHLIWYFTKKVDTSVAANALNAANKAIRVMKNGGAVGVNDIVAMLLPNGGFHTAASGVEGGTIIEGTLDVKAEVDDIDNETYLIFCDETTRGDCPTVTAASLTFYDIVAGLKVYYCVA